MVGQHRGPPKALGRPDEGRPGRCCGLKSVQLFLDGFHGERLLIDLDASYPLDLSFSEDGIGADLSFGGYVTRCTFPWKAIYVVADRATGRGIVLDQNMPESVRRSRAAPTTGPLPTGGDLREVFEAKDNRVVPGRRNRRNKPPVKQALPGSSQPAAEAKTDHRDDEVQRRRAAFKVIDGGS